MRPFWQRYLLGALSALVIVILIYHLPPVHRRLAWRVDVARTTLRMLWQPVGAPPTPAAPVPTVSTATPPYPTPTRPPATAASTTAPTLTPTPSPTLLPPVVTLEPPRWEAQDWNNCGPTTLALYLRWWGWEGDQYDISGVVKPKREDRNVNVEELVGFVNEDVSGMSAVYRVGGDLTTLKRILAAEMPVMIEESMYFEKKYWPNDDRWAAHYLLLTGYDDERQQFITLDSFRGPDRRVAYDELRHNWEAFNFVYILVFPNGRLAQIQALLGEDWNTDTNRTRALEKMQAATQRHPDDAYAWFNLGTNLLYFERYPEAAQAYDRALQLGLPQRFLRYQFGPFIAYFQTARFEDLLALTDYALKVTPNSEEALLWRGWALYRLGRKREAVAAFQAALEAHPRYPDAIYALRFLGVMP